jgi:outer membrane protein assembly factor BamD (BamD/ComL family)
MDIDRTTTPGLPALREHPLYEQGMAQSAAGQWQQAFKSFHLLQSIYPDNAEAKELLKSAEMRAPLARFQPRQASRVSRHLSFRRLLFATLVAIVITIAAYVAYEMWINPLVTQEVRLRQISMLRSEADEAVAAGDFAQARQSLQELQSVFPEDPEADEALRRVEQVERMSELYDEGKALMNANNWDQAIEALTELQGLDAEYRDLPQLLTVAQESQALDRQFQAAEEAFAGGDWPRAIAKYQALHQANLTFRFEEIQARLFQSHLKYGQALVQEAGADPELVAEAIPHFSEALKLRPIDDEALDERRLTEIYLAALGNGDQDDVIDRLKIIYAQQPDYAGNEAAQLLYTALLQRADSFLSTGNKGAAIADYQVAAQLLVEDASEAQEMLADLTSEATP